MIITRNQPEHGNLLPSAFNTIAALPEAELHHEDHGIRHPASSYSTSLRLIALQWLKFLAHLEKMKSDYRWEGKTSTASETAEQYAQLLHRLHEHHDACCAVIRSVCPPNRAKPNRVDALYLENAGLPGWRSFRDATRGYREAHLGVIVNNLKHRQGELRPLSFLSATEFRPGFYLLDVLKSGIVGPNRELHSGGNTAFSFARDQLIHLWWLYRIGDLLTSALTAVSTELHLASLTTSAQDCAGLPWIEMLAKLAALEPAYFPDELAKPRPLALLSACTATFSIQFPAKAKGIPVNTTGLTVQTEHTCDRAYLTLKVPYFGYMS